MLISTWVYYNTTKLSTKIHFRIMGTVRVRGRGHTLPGKIPNDISHRDCSIIRLSLFVTSASLILTENEAIGACSAGGWRTCAYIIFSYYYYCSYYYYYYYYDVMHGYRELYKVNSDLGN